MEFGEVREPTPQSGRKVEIKWPSRFTLVSMFLAAGLVYPPIASSQEEQVPTEQVLVLGRNPLRLEVSCSQEGEINALGRERFLKLTINGIALERELDNPHDQPFWTRVENLETNKGATVMYGMGTQNLRASLNGFAEAIRGGEAAPFELEEGQPYRVVVHESEYTDGEPDLNPENELISTSLRMDCEPYNLDEVIESFDAQEGDPNYNPRYDVNNDRRVNSRDVSAALRLLAANQP